MDSIAPLTGLERMTAWRHSSRKRWPKAQRIDCALKSARRKLQQGSLSPAWRDCSNALPTASRRCSTILECSAGIAYRLDLSARAGI